MSKFLGPIHYIMYEKIKFQDQISKVLLTKDQLDELDKLIAPVPLDDLDQIIDQDNIHGFLSAKIDIVESRLAYAIANGHDIYNKAYEFGKSLGPKDFDSYDEIFNKINLIILDGMPCDHALDASFDEDGFLNLITNVDTHKKYAYAFLEIDPSKSLSNTCQGNHGHDDHESFHIKENHENLDYKSNNSKYFKLREALLRGFLEPSKHELERKGQNFIIK